MDISNLIIFLLIGALAGWIAGNVITGRGFGVLGNIVVGIIGAVLGGVMFPVIGLAATSRIGEIITATVGAIVLLYIVLLIKKA